MKNEVNMQQKRTLESHCFAAILYYFFHVLCAQLGQQNRLKHALTTLQPEVFTPKL